MVVADLCRPRDVNLWKVDLHLGRLAKKIGENVHGDMGDDLDDLSVGVAGASHRVEFRLRDLAHVLDQRRANISAASALASAERPVRLASISWLSRPTLRPMAVWANTQYWRAFCSATESAIRSRVLGSRTPTPAIPCNPR